MAYKVDQSNSHNFHAMRSMSSDEHGGNPFILPHWSHLSSIRE